MQRRTAAFALTCAAVLAACQVIAGIDRVSKVTEASEGGGASSSSSSGTVQRPTDPCNHVSAPAKPAASDPGGDDTSQFYLATKTLSLAKPASNGINGLDLDGTCTCDTRPGSAFDGSASCNAPPGGMTTCDLDGGVDNEGLALFSKLFSETGQDYDQSINADLTSGKRTLMLYVQGWNGQKNDLEVQTAIFISNGTPTDPATGTFTVPKFDGTDTWSYPSTIRMINGQFVPAATEPGYVTNGRLVVQNNLAVTIIFGDTGLAFGDSVVLGDLAKDTTTGLISFTGIIGGRIKQSDLLGAAGQIKVSATGYVCNDNGGLDFLVVKQAICPGADIASTHGTDFTGSTCDSVSSTLSIEAFQAAVGGDAAVDPPNDGANPCTPGQATAPPYACP